MNRLLRTAAAARAVARVSLVAMSLVAGCGGSAVTEAEDRDETTTSWTAGDDAPLDRSPEPSTGDEPDDGAGGEPRAVGDLPSSGEDR